MKIDWTWLLIGIVLGWFVVPMLQGFVQAQFSKGE